MKKKNGFTLVEVLSVIIIMGIILLIAIPAVTKYIFKTDKSVYASNVYAYVESIRGKYEMKEYGRLLDDNEIMIVPIGHIILEKGDSKSSPYGEYDFDRSYVLIVPERSGYNYYATVIDSSNYGFINVASTLLSEEMVQEKIDKNNIPLISSYQLPNATYTYNEETYKRTDARAIEGENINLGQYVYVFTKVTP